MHRRQYLTSLSVGSLVGVTGCSSQHTAGPETSGPPRLQVEGRWVTDPDGNPVVLRGVTVVDPIWGIEHERKRGRDYWDTLRLATDASEGWYARVLRIPVQPRSISEAGLDTIVEHLDRAVELAAEQDVYVLIDYHASERYDTASIDRRLRTFWDRVAPRYANNSHVIYELFRAPTEPAAGEIEAWRNWREHASPWVSLVQNHAPDTPIVVGSPALSSMTAYADEEPFAQDNLLYSAQLYPSWEPHSWEETFGTPALEVPVFVTEWGYANIDTTDSSLGDYLIGTTDAWGEPFRAWVDAHENIHWCATKFDSRRQPAMFDDNWTLREGNDHMGSLVKEWLADRRQDHQPGEATSIPSGEGSAPMPPESVRIDRVHETGATVRWEAPPDPDGDDILQYRVTVNDREPVILRGVEQSVMLSDLTPDQAYEASVTAVDERGLESRSTSVAFRTLDRRTPEATIPRTSSAPIDNADAWQLDEPRLIDMVLWTDRSFETTANWQAVWDKNSLYIRIEITNIEDWQDTFADVYLDLDNSREMSYDGENDLQMIVQRDSAVIVQGANSSPITEDTSVRTTEIENGWRAEFTIPWGDYGIRPIIGHRIGMDAHVIIKDAGERVAKLGWFDESDAAWEVPQKFATVELGE